MDSMLAFMCTWIAEIFDTPIQCRVFLSKMKSSKKSDNIKRPNEQVQRNSIFPTLLKEAKGEREGEGVVRGGKNCHYQKLEKT